MVFDIKQRDVCVAYLSSINSSIQRGYRPVIVIQNNVLNTTSATFVVIPLTSKEKHGDIHYTLAANKENGLAKDSTVLCENIMTVGKTFFKSKLGSISQEEFDHIMSTLQNVFISQMGGSENEVR